MSTVDRQLLGDIGKSLKLARVWIFLGQRDLKARFRGSFIGPLWILLNLGLFVGGAGLVYGALFGQPMHEFLPFLTAGFVIWGFISATIVESGHTFIIAEGYIKQFSFPKQVYLLRMLVSSAAVFGIGLLALFVLRIVTGSFDLLGWMYAIPGILLLLAAGLAHICLFAYLGARFVDLPHALGGILQIFFFLTPIIFPADTLRDRGLDFIYRFNPLYYLIEIVRAPILTDQFAAADAYFFAMLYVVVVFLLAYLTARKMDRKLVFVL